MALALTETVLFHWDCVNYFCHESGQASAKDDWTGVGDWADKLASSQGIAEIVSSSELDEFGPPPPPTPSCIPSKKRSAKHPASQQAPRSKGQSSMERAQSDQPDNDSDETSVAPLLSKRAKTAPHSVSGPQCSGSGVNNKYIKDDLPHGCTNDNVWRQLFLSALAHFMAGYNDPWTIPSEKFRLVLQVIWDMVYRGNIKHAKQSVNNWRGGFAAAAISMVTMFFTHDPDFGDASQHIEFSKAMLKKNQFLYDQNRGVDSKAWSSLWRAPFVFQVFTHHFNYIQGQAEVPSLNDEVEGPRTALALACAAVCHILTLVAKNKVVFQPSGWSNVWTTVIPKGNQYKFNDIMWGATTHRYLDPIKNLSHEHFVQVVEEIQRFVKKPVSNLNAGDLGDSGSGYDKLFAFH
ncbi:hypothetical protein BDN67DRAFT_984590 [Paxillus ammoniavirescens]|nr:hypothetical protein BDN67DRAFT_984590 [Paxillus ammoniavirescens]